MAHRPGGAGPALTAGGDGAISPASDIETINTELILAVQTYLTAGPRETRAWTIRVGDTAPKGAGVIHTEFERGFVKAEVVSFDDLVAAGSMTEAKAAGKVRMEGKEEVW